MCGNNCVVIFVIYLKFLGTLCEECCPTDLEGFCADLTHGRPHCGYGECDELGCNCKGGCRMFRKGRECCYPGPPFTGHCPRNHLSHFDADTTEVSTKSTQMLYNDWNNIFCITTDCNMYGCECTNGCSMGNTASWIVHLLNDTEFGLIWGTRLSHCVDLNFGDFGKTGRISSIYVLMDCIVLYPEPNCSGQMEDFIFLNSDMHSLNKDFNKGKVQSIGPCYDIPRKPLFLQENQDNKLTDKLNQIKGAFGIYEINIFLLLPSVLILTIFGISILAYIIYSRKLFRIIHNRLKDGDSLTSVQTHLAENKDIYNCDENYKGFRIPKDDIDFDGATYLDCGNFGQILLAKYKGAEKVILKTTKNHNDLQQLEVLKKELKIFRKISTSVHSNIIKFYGVCFENIDNRSLHIVVEYCPLGSLEKYLRFHSYQFKNLFAKKIRNHSNKVLDTEDLIKWAYQIASGMVYLQYLNIIHGDLATRNILLYSKDCVKITDFGLSKNLYKFIGEHGDRIYRQRDDKRLPIPWLAIETLLEGIFSTETDIWAYGVTLWEIFSLGETPYLNLINTVSPNAFKKKIKKGERLGKPLYSNDIIFAQICRCWKKKPMSRPKFLYLKQFFEEFSMGDFLQV